MRRLAVVLAAALAAASCARGAAPTGSSRDARKDDVRELWMQIREWRVELGIGADPVKREAAGVLAQPRDGRCAAPAEPPGEVCRDVCNLKDAICDNADSICRIADELGDDAWAADKCKSGKASCKEAAERCCACGATPPG